MNHIIEHCSRCNTQMWENQSLKNECDFSCGNSNKNCSDLGQGPNFQFSENNSKKTSTRAQAPVPDYVRVLMVTDVCGRQKEIQVPAALDLERPKRPRTTFTQKQLAALEREFENHHNVSETKRVKLSQQLGLTQTQIKVWFQNRRTKYRRMGASTSSSSFLSQSSRSSYYHPFGAPHGFLEPHPSSPSISSIFDSKKPEYFPMTAYSREPEAAPATTVQVPFQLLPVRPEPGQVCSSACGRVTFKTPYPVTSTHYSYGTTSSCSF